MREDSPCLPRGVRRPHLRDHELGRSVPRRRPSGVAAAGREVAVHLPQQQDPEVIRAIVFDDSPYLLPRWSGPSRSTTVRICCMECKSRWRHTCRSALISRPPAGGMCATGCYLPSRRQRERHNVRICVRMPLPLGMRGATTPRCPQNEKKNQRTRPVSSLDQQDPRATETCPRRPHGCLSVGCRLPLPDGERCEGAGGGTCG